jgi:hypothetical protein
MSSTEENTKARVSIVVTYNLADAKITRGRICFAIPVLMAQLGVGGA